MDRTVGRIVQPRAVLNDGIGRFLALHKHEYAVDLTALTQNIALALRNIIFDEIALRIAVHPLRGISLFIHVTLGDRVDLHHAIEIVHGRFSDFCHMLFQNAINESAFTSDRSLRCSFISI